jgi:hypothetical protein
MVFPQGLLAFKSFDGMGDLLADVGVKVTRNQRAYTDDTH